MANASKKFGTSSPGPWESWEETCRACRCIRFLESYLRLPKGYGSGELMKLAPFQKEWIHSVLADGVSSAVMSVPRGNGKSTLLAGVATWAVFDKDPEVGNPQVPIIATTVMQAHRSVYGVALEMIEAEPELRNRALIHTAIGNMKVITLCGGEMFPVSSDPAGLQGLDPSVAVVDEIGFQPIESWDSLLLASGKRPRSLVVGIGTPGLDKENALWHLRKRVNEGMKIKGFRFTEFAAPEQCDVKDEDVWRGANPALNSGYMNIDALRTAVEISPEGHFRIFRLGQWVDGTDCWLGADGRRVWEALRTSASLIPGADTWVGIDVGLKRDSTAIVLLQRQEDRWYAESRVWMPTNDEPVDLTDVMHYIRQLDLTYKLREVPFDPRFFDVPAKMLYDEGVPMVEYPQSVERMTTACGGTLELIKRGELSHNGDDVFTTHVLNAIPRFNERGFTLQKSKSRGKIDACIALCMAVDRATHAKPPKAPLVVL